MCQMSARRLTASLLQVLAWCKKFEKAELAYWSFPISERVTSMREAVRACALASFTITQCEHKKCKVTQKTSSDLEQSKTIQE